MARLRFTGRYPSSGGRKLSVNRFLRENIKTGLEGPDKAKYQHQGWAKSEYRSGPDRSIKLKCFLYPLAESEVSHFWVIATEPNADGQFAVANLTSLKGNKDQAVVLRRANTDS